MFVGTDVTTMALGFVSVLSPYDDEPNPEEASVALRHFDALLAEMMGTKTFWWMVPGQQEITVTNGEEQYDLNVKLGGGTRLMMMRDAHLRYQNRTCRLRMLRRWEFDSNYKPECLGTPDRIYIDRLEDPTAILMDTPNIDGAKLVLTGIEFPPDVTADDGEVDLRFPKAWLRCMALKTAVDIGAGPVVTLSDTRHNKLLKMAMQAEKHLNAFNNRENVQGPRFTKPRSF